jgi:hypothetical protein
MIAGNDLLVKRDLVINKSADFNACSGTSAVPDSMMMGACGFRNLISKSERLPSANAFFYLGLSVAVSAFLVRLLRFRRPEAPSRTAAGAATIGARSAH